MNSAGAALGLLVGGCGAPHEAAVSNASATPSPTTATPCGFSELSKLDQAAWTAVDEARTERSLGSLRGPRPVGSCVLHVADGKEMRYTVRDGAREIALITHEGTLLEVPMIGFEVGLSTDVVLAKHPPDQYSIGCGATRLGNLCGFKPTGLEINAAYEFLVGGELRGVLRGIAAYEFFRHKTVRGVQIKSRVD